LYHEASSNDVYMFNSSISVTDTQVLTNSSNGMVVCYGTSVSEVAGGAYVNVGAIGVARIQRGYDTDGSMTGGLIGDFINVHYFDGGWSNGIDYDIRRSDGSWNTYQCYQSSSAYYNGWYHRNFLVNELSGSSSHFYVNLRLHKSDGTVYTMSVDGNL